MSLDLKSSPNPSWNHGGPLAWGTCAWHSACCTSDSTLNCDAYASCCRVRTCCSGGLRWQAWSALSRAAGLISLKKRRPSPDKAQPATGREYPLDGAWVGVAKTKYWPEFEEKANKRAEVVEKRCAAKHCKIQSKLSKKAQEKTDKQCRVASGQTLSAEPLLRLAYSDLSDVPRHVE